VLFRSGRVPSLTALLRRPDRFALVGVDTTGQPVTVPRPRSSLACRQGTGRSVPPVVRGADLLRLVDVAPPSSGPRRGPLAVGIALGALVLVRRRAR